MTAHPSTESLEAVHTFPCRFLIKAIGANNEEFVAAVRGAAETVLGDPPEGGEITTTTRASSKGSHLSVTLEFPARTPEDVQAIYAHLKELDTLRYIL